MAWSAKDLRELALTNPRITRAYSRCFKCQLFFWNRIWKRHVKACKGRKDRSRFGYPT